MNSQLFLDSLNLLLSDLERRAMRTLTNPSTSPHSKSDRLTSIVVTFRADFLRSLNKLISHPLQAQLHPRLKQQLHAAEQTQRKLQLHTLLRRKIASIQNTTMMLELEQAQASGWKQSQTSGWREKEREGDGIGALKNSVLLIEKDLGMGQQDDQDGLGYQYDDYDVSSVIHRSMASLEHTLLGSSRMINQSMVDHSSIMDHSVISENGNENENGNGNFRRNIDTTSHGNKIADDGTGDVNGNKIADTTRIRNDNKIVDTTNIDNGNSNQVVSSRRKKKKAGIDGNNKGKMFQNLLEESYNQSSILQ